MTDSNSQPSDDNASQIFRGPANWFSMSVPNELQLEQTEAFVEIRPQRTEPSSAESSTEPAPWSLTIYSTWVADDDEIQPAAFDPSELFPVLVSSKEVAGLSVGETGRAWSGVSGGRQGGWMASLLRRRLLYEWRLWVIEHQEIVIVASLQSARGIALDDTVVAVCIDMLESVTFSDVLARPPELFRRDVLDLARQHFPLLKCESTSGFGIRIADSEVNLANFYRSYLLQPHQFRDIVLPGLTTMVRMQEWGPDQLMPPLTEVSQRIMPMLYGQEEAEETLKGFLRIPWVGGLCIMFVVDEDDTYRFVHEAMLQRWELDKEEVHELAMQNLERFTKDNPLEVSVVGENDTPRMLVPVNANAYNTARLLGSDLHHRLRQVLGPELVIGVPNRDFFVAVSLAQPTLIDDIQQRVIEDYRSMHHPLTSRLLLISADGVSEYCG